MLRRRNERKSGSVPLFVVSKPTYLLLLHNGGTVRQTDIWGEVIGGLRWEEVKAEAPDRRKTKQRERERERERERRDFFQNFLGFNFFPFCICIRLQRERKKKERPSCFEMKGAKSRKNWNEIRCQKQTFLLFCTHARAREEINKRFFF